MTLGCGSIWSLTTSPPTRRRRSASGPPSPTSSSSSLQPTPASSIASSATSGRSAKFVINNADYPDWDTFAKAMADHIRYRNGPHRDRRLIKAERRLLIAA